MKSFEELKQQDQIDAEEALKLSMEEHLKATGNVHNLKASEIGSTLPQWNANKILGNPVRFVSDKDGNTLQYNEKEQSFDLKPTPKLEFLGEGDIKVSKVGEKVVIKSDISKSDTIVGLKHAINTKAPSVHEHKDYVLKGDLNSKLLKLSEDKSSKNHSHNNYVTFPIIEKLKGELDKSLEVGLSKKAEKSHKHDLKIPTFKKEFGKIEKDIDTLQKVVGVVGDKSNLATKSDLKIAVSEVVSLPVKKHEHTEYAKGIEIDKLKKTITELKIVDKKGSNKAISDLLAYKAERNHGHKTTEIIDLEERLSQISSVTSWGSITGTLSAQTDLNTALNDRLKLDGTNSMSGVLTSTVTTGTAPLTIASTTKNTNLNADLLDDANLSIDGTFASNSDLLIPTEKATKTYVGANLWTLALGSPANGLTLTGTSAKTLTLSETGIVKLSGLSLASSYTAGANQLIFPQGAGGSSAPGFRFQGGQTDGGLAMNDGILEFWNNFSEYTTPIAGHMQAVFRLDSRSGYETESYVLGGKDLSGNWRMCMTADFTTAHTNFNSYGVGSTAFGAHVTTLGISGLDGCIGVYNDIYAGRDIVVNSAGGMKIGTATTQKLGFYNATPVVQPSAYTVTNPSTDRAFDVSSTSVNELASVLGTLIGDLKSLGLIG